MNHHEKLVSKWYLKRNKWLYDEFCEAGLISEGFQTSLERYGTSKNQLDRPFIIMYCDECEGQTQWVFIEEIDNKFLFRCLNIK
jgi:hypothetical protein